jgi:branched-chain amino acid transport system substrate-binding protein
MRIHSSSRRRIPVPLVAAALGTVAALALAACSSGGASPSASSSVKAASGDPVNVGFINQQAGSAANLERNSQATQAAVDYINAELGGVDGHPIKLTVCATDGTPASTQTCAQQMVSLKPAWVSIGSDNNMGVAYPILSAANIPVLGGTPASNADIAATGARYWVGGVISVIAGAAQYLLQYQPKVKKVGVLVFNLPAGQAAVPLIQKPLEKNGVTVVVNQVSTTATDMLSPYTALKNEGVQAIYAIVLAQQCTALAQAAQSQDNKILILAQPGCYSQQIVQQAGGAMTGWTFPLYGPDPNGNDKQAVLFRDKMKKYAPNVAIDTYTEVSFGEMMTVYNNIAKPTGYAKIGTTDLLKVADDPKGGDVFLGSTYKCGSNTSFPSICSFGSRWYKIADANGTLADQTKGEYVDALKVLG